MKNPISLFILMVFITAAISAQTISTQQDGEWNEHSTWVGSNNAPGYVLTSNKSTLITITAGHKVYTDFKDLTITGNNGIINVNGELTIKGDLIIDANGWDINVADDAIFIVTGDVVFEQPAQGNPASPDLNINGIATIGGNLTGIGNLLGNGELYMTGTVDGAIKVNLFNGNIVYGKTDISLPAPSNLDATEIPDPIRIYLEWDFPTLTSVITDRYNFLGFQVFTNNDRPTMPTHESKLIAVTEIPGIDTITTTETTFMHEASFVPGQTPKYYVRAAYWDTTTSEVVYSTISIFDFLGHGVLPISLVSLKAKKEFSSIAINWTTATEVNNLGFEIQRSDYTGNNWQTIGFVDGHYNHNGLLDYIFTDHAPLTGINYYRLRQIDYDGKWEIFGPVAENMRDASAAIQVVKSAGSVYVQLPEQGLLEIFDMSGRKISSYSHIDHIQLPLSRGNYILRYSNEVDVLSIKIIL